MSAAQPSQPASAARDFAEWARDRAKPDHRLARYTDWLKELAEPTWSEAVRHRFTRELAEGTLEADVFRRYLVQDYSFVDGFVSLVGFAIGRAPSLAERIRLTRFLAGVTSEENTYFQRAFDALDVAPDDRAQPELKAVTRAFHALMREAAEAGSYADIIAVLTVVEWVYLSWATAVRDRSPSSFYFAEWIDLHANETFADFVGWLRGQLDVIGPALPPERAARVAELFQKAVRLEKAFFDAAYDEEA